MSAVDDFGAYPRDHDNIEGFEPVSRLSSSIFGGEIHGDWTHPQNEGGFHFTASGFITSEEGASSGDWFMDRWEEGKGKVEPDNFNDKGPRTATDDYAWSDSVAFSDAAHDLVLARTATFVTSSSNPQQGKKRSVGITVSKDLARTASMESSSSDQPLTKKKRIEFAEESFRVQDSKKIDKKERLHWSDELHSRFLAALQVVGVNATPTTILGLMNVDGLRREQVKSHLQKFKQHQNKIRSSGVDDLSKLSKRELSYRQKLLDETIEIAVREKTRLEEKLAKHQEWLNTLESRKRELLVNQANADE